MRATLFTAAILLAVAPAAFAQEAISTAPASGPAAPPAEAAATPVAALDQPPPEPRPTGMGLCGPQAVKDDGTLETKPHGVVQVGVGTGGYRQVAASVCQPLGQNAAVAVSISDTRGSFGGPPGRRSRFARN